jgi:hypothetical protein
MGNLLLAKFRDKSEMQPFVNVKTKRIPKILQTRGTSNWEYATLMQGGRVKAYYYHTTGTDPISLEEYQKALGSDRINFYIIYTHEHKVKTGRSQGRTVTNRTLAEMPNYWNDSVLKVQAYRANRLIAEMHEPHQIKHL